MWVVAWGVQCKVIYSFPTTLQPLLTCTWPVCSSTVEDWALSPESPGRTVIFPQSGVIFYFFLHWGNKLCCCWQWVFLGSLTCEGSITNAHHISALLRRCARFTICTFHPRQSISSSAAFTKMPGNQALQLPCTTSQSNTLYQPVAIWARGDMWQHIQIHVPCGKLVIAAQ